jgi:hypothetical protein
MEKKESLKKNALNKETQNATPNPFAGKFAKAYGKIFGILKFLFGVCLIPFIYSTSYAFLNELGSIEPSLQRYFWAGCIVFLLIYLFIWEPAKVYSAGHKLLEIVFSFFQPLVRFAPYLLPIYTIVLFIAYGILSLFIKSDWLLNYALFAFGLTITLHLVFSAKTIRGKKGDFLKGNYIFGFSFIYIINLAFLAMGLNVIFAKFSFVNFANLSLQIAGGIFGAIFKQLFVP